VSLAFLLDEDITPAVAEGLRRRGIDAVSVHDLGLANARVPDEAHLAAAATAGRVLVTYNRADFQALDAQWRLDDRPHAGILWCAERSIPRRNVGELVRALVVASQRYESLSGLCLPLERPAAE
jgi:predicted nuclease of predicted toxin-antitoxin system